MLCIPGFAVGQTPERFPKLSVGGFLGYHVFDEDNELGVISDIDNPDSVASSFAFGGRVGFVPMAPFALEGELAMYPSSARQGEASAFVLGYRLQALGIAPLGAFRPFAVLGLGAMTVFSDDPAELEDDTDFQFYGGLGAMFAVVPNLSVRLDGRTYLAPKALANELTANFEVVLGVHYEIELGRPEPVTDPDGDKLLEPDDRCPYDAEDLDGFEDHDGCPDPDNDRDAVPDFSDRCPLEPETRNGFADDDGCPDDVPDDVKRYSGVIEGITFETAKAIIKPQSYPVLDDAVRVLREYPGLRVEISGHTDNVGSYDDNLALSRQRAEAVVEYFVAAGIDPGRLRAVGYGSDKPIDSNDTDAGRARNRRVEFKLESQP